MPRSKLDGYNEKFPPTTGECWICCEHGDNVRFFMDKLVHIECLQRHVSGTILCFQDRIDAEKRSAKRKTKTSLPK